MAAGVGELPGNPVAVDDNVLSPLFAMEWAVDSGS